MVVRDAGLPAEPAVLIVDDEPDVASAIAEQLEFDGLRVLVAGTGAQARRMLGEQPVALLLLDLQLPDVNGLKLLQEVRATSDPPDVVVVTGETTLDEVFRVAL